MGRDTDAVAGAGEATTARAASPVPGFTGGVGSLCMDVGTSGFGASSATSTSISRRVQPFAFSMTAA